jgi:hypothetical protein
MIDIVIRAESLSKLDKIGALKQRHDPYEHHSTKACNDANSCPALRTGVRRGIRLSRDS